MLLDRAKHPSPIPRRATRTVAVVRVVGLIATLLMRPLALRISTHPPLRRAAVEGAAWRENFEDQGLT